MDALGERGSSPDKALFVDSRTTPLSPGSAGTRWSSESASLAPSPQTQSSFSNLSIRCMGSSLIDSIAVELKNNPLIFDHKPLPDRLSAGTRLVDVDSDPFEHLRRARLAQHPSSKTWAMETSLHFAAEKLAAFQSQTNSWRRQMLDEIKQVKLEMSEEIEEWHSSAPEFVKQAYMETEFCVPLFIFLVRALDFPDAEQLNIDLSGGFDLAGEIPSGVGWPSAPEPGPSLSWEEFSKANDEFISGRLRRLRDLGTARGTAEYDFLLSELINERGMGRVRGPFEAPQKWGVEASLPEGCGAALIPAPRDDECYPSIAFPILQVGADGLQKIRRGEDWKRSFHNRLSRTYGKPVHHTLDHYLQAARILHLKGFRKFKLWGHDHEGAYRQFPARQRRLMWAILEGDCGFSLWQHCVMVFGAKAAVWAYNRVGDAVIFIFRVLLFGISFHYVDDYGGIEPELLADSAFEAFFELSQLLGFKTKISKEQPPASKQIMLGIDVQVTDEDFITAVTKNRKKRMLAEIEEYRATQRIVPKQARQLAGKSVFTNASTFGSLGAAALRPLYRRAAYGGSKLDTDIGAALHMLDYLLRHAPPRSSSLALPAGEAPILYADAFYTCRGATRKASQLTTDDLTDPNAAAGWGVVVISGRDAWHFSGTVPHEVFLALKKKKTYIFLLEVVAQCMGTWLLAKELQPYFWAFVDNVGAEHALRKGFSKDRDANAIISLFWAMAAHCVARPWFERVPSDAQFADGVSRGDDTAAQYIGSKRLDFDYDEIWGIIIKIVEGGGLANADHRDLMLAAVNRQRARFNLDLLDSNGGTLERVGRLRWAKSPPVPPRLRTLPLALRVVPAEKGVDLDPNRLSPACHTHLFVGEEYVVHCMCSPTGGRLYCLAV